MSKDEQYREKVIGHLKGNLPLATNFVAEELQKRLDESYWPRDIWTMSFADIKANIPDSQIRSAVSGVLYRSGWDQCNRIYQDLLSRSGLKIVACVSCCRTILGVGEYPEYCNFCGLEGGE